jgi:nicotinamidase-related amidase
LKRLFGPIPDGAIHLVVDMQELFRSHPDWGTASLTQIVPPIQRLLKAKPDNAYFSRFIPPQQMDHATGAWRRYYQRWHRVTLDRMDPALVNVIEELRPWERGIVDKTGYSALGNPGFRRTASESGDRCLILSGVETDVCVLSTAMEAMDLGLRVILALDAITSSSARCHELALQIIHERFDEQVELATVDDILNSWQQTKAS